MHRSQRFPHNSDKLADREKDRKAICKGLALLSSAWNDIRVLFGAASDRAWVLLGSQRTHCPRRKVSRRSRSPACDMQGPSATDDGSMGLSMSREESPDKWYTSHMQGIKQVTGGCGSCRVCATRLDTTENDATYSEFRYDSEKKPSRWEAQERTVILSTC